MQLNVRLLLGRGIANHPGLVRAIREAGPGECVLAMHHTTKPATAGEDAVDVFVPERGGTGNRSDSYVDDLLAASDDFGATHVWPGRELVAVGARSGEFHARGITLLGAASAEVAEILDDKDRFAKAVSMAHALGAVCVRAPSSVRFNDEPSFVAAYESIRASGDRVCIKPVRGVYGRGFRVIREDLDLFAEIFEEPGHRLDYDDARRRLRSRTSFSPMVAMPWLDGPEWSVDCFASSVDDAFVAVPRRKIGADTQLLDDVPEIIEASRQLARHFGLRGVFNCQFKAHRGVPHVLEINARPAGAIGLSLHAGVNLLGLAWREALGLPNVSSPPRLGFNVRATSKWQAVGDTVPIIRTQERPSLSSTTIAVLPTGTLSLSAVAGSWSVESLVGAGARNNPRRPFLLVSKVLGKHLPVTPARMAEAHAALAARLPADLPGPVCFVGLAETATGLGWGVFEAWRARTRRNDTIVVHSTRAPMPECTTFGFEEVHSHGPAQVVCIPEVREVREVFATARTLVIVDDELTTGSTVCSLRRAFIEHRQAQGWFGSLSTTAVALVTSASARAKLEKGDVDGNDDEIAVVALADIDVAFSASPDGTDPGDSFVTRELSPLGPGIGLRRFGRAGAAQAPALPDAILARALAFSRSANPCFVVGAGECMHPAFILGRALEAQGITVLVQSSTRSPVLPGGVIRGSLPVEGGVDVEIPYFMHNPPPRGARVIALFEPGAERSTRALVEAYGALALEVWDEQ
jgi:hypothetical protein